MGWPHSLVFCQRYLPWPIEKQLFELDNSVAISVLRIPTWTLLTNCVFTLLYILNCLFSCLDFTGSLTEAFWKISSAFSLLMQLQVFGTGRVYSRLGDEPRRTVKSADIRDILEVGCFNLRMS